MITDLTIVRFWADTAPYPDADRALMGPDEIIVPFTPTPGMDVRQESDLLRVRYMVEHENVLFLDRHCRIENMPALLALLRGAYGPYWNSRNGFVQVQACCNANMHPKRQGWFRECLAAYRPGDPMWLHTYLHLHWGEISMIPEEIISHKREA